MTDNPIDTDIKKGKFIFSVAVGWTGYIVSLTIVVFVIGTAMFMWATGQEVPEKLVDWGTVCLGFLAMLISQARDIIKLGKEDQ